ncbi:MAG TPA: ribosome maturation factor RimM [Nitrolancea sp.]|jgi:16S rRNA processing protein RimM|nr:ribosome maturation factor RimM [Nitrolancea sp.]
MAESGPDQPDRLAIGVIVAPHGTRGEIRMQLWTQFPEHLNEVTAVYVGDERHPRRLRRVNLAKGSATLSLQGIANRESAETKRGMVVRIDREQAAPLEDGEFYQFELLGLQVETEDGKPVGTLVEIIETGANDVYVVRGEDGKDTLFPALKDVVPIIDLETRKMIVRPLDYWDSGV